MKRLQVEEAPVQVVSSGDFEQDWKRGYAILEWKPESYSVRRNPVNGQEIRIKVDAVPNYCCMRCAFSTPEKKYIVEHVFRDTSHKWRFGPFRTPYGNIAHVRIADVEDYDQLVRERIEQ